jgi:hypothetical protein
VSLRTDAADALERREQAVGSGRQPELGEVCERRRADQIREAGGEQRTLTSLGAAAAYCMALRGL